MKKLVHVLFLIFNLNTLSFEAHVDLNKEYCAPDNLLYNPALLYAIEPYSVTLDSGSAHKAEITKDGRYIAVAQHPNLVRIFDLIDINNPTVIHTIQHVRSDGVNDGQVGWIFITDDNRYLITTSTSVTKVTGLADNYKEINSFEHAMFSRIKISSDGKYMVGLSYINEVNVIDISKKNKPYRIIIDYGIHSMDITSDGRYIISKSYGKTVKITDMHSENDDKTITFHDEGLISAVAIESRGKYIVICNNRIAKIMYISDIGNPKIIHAIGHGHIKTVKISSNGKYIATASESDGDGLARGVKITDLTDINNPKTIDLSAASNYYSPLSITPNGRFVVSGAWQTARIIDLHDINNPRHVYDIKDDGNVSEVKIADDAKYVLSISYPGDVKVTYFMTPKIIRDLSSPQLQLINWLYCQKNKSGDIKFNPQQWEIFDSLPKKIRKNLKKNYNLEKGFLDYCSVM